MTTKREIVLDNLPDDHCITVDELAHEIAVKDEVKYTRQELTKTLELLRKSGDVEINNRPIKAGGNTYSKVKKPLRRGPPAKPYVVLKSVKREEEVNSKQKVITLIDEIDTTLISLSGKMDKLKVAVGSLDDCNKEELEALRLWKQRFKELIND